jgi:hypothetical protein
MTKILCVACCFLNLAVPLLGQIRRPVSAGQTAVAPPYQRPVLVTQRYEQTWYDALLRQFNPDNLDWGHWLEQRREALLEQTAANPYFKYGLVTTMLLIVLTIAFAKAEIDKSRIKWLAQERHEDLLAHDRHSRQVAIEAIRKYNNHMEKCNRVVEAQMAGRSVAAPTPPVAEGTMTLQQAATENAQLKREREQLRSELDIHKALVNDLTMRMDSISAGGDGSANGGRVQGDVVRQLNELREKLYRERERNKQLKGM